MVEVFLTTFMYLTGALLWVVLFAAVAITVLLLINPEKPTEFVVGVLALLVLIPMFAAYSYGITVYECSWPEPTSIECEIRQ